MPVFIKESVSVTVQERFRKVQKKASVLQRHPDQVSRFKKAGQLFPGINSDSAGHLQKISFLLEQRFRKDELCVHQGLFVQFACFGQFSLQGVTCNASTAPFAGERMLVFALEMILL
jgi:hypothetical protein